MSVTKKNQIFKCDICGNIVEVVHVGGGELVCCGQPMRLIEANTVDAAKEKHVPVVEILDDRVIVRIGSVPHPMEEKHYIEWIELMCDDKVYRKYLKPGENPEAEFMVAEKDVRAREYCNLHGLWKN